MCSLTFFGLDICFYIFRTIRDFGQLMKKKNIKVGLLYHFVVMKKLYCKTTIIKIKTEIRCEFRC